MSGEIRLHDEWFGWDVLPCEGGVHSDEPS